MAEALATEVVEIRNHPTAEVVKVPRLGFGVFQIPPEETEAAVQCAITEGYRHFDTAFLFRNEAAVGRAILSCGLPREDIFVSTKLWNADHGFQNTLSAFNRSLQNLGLDYVDLYMVHSPLRADARLETWRAMEAILATGKARSIGVSNYGVHHLQELFERCSVRPAVNQIEVNPFNSRQELVAFCEENNIKVQAYSPLTKGHKLKEPALIEMSKRYQRSAAQLLICWSLQKGYMPIVKSSNPLHIASNALVYDFEISAADMQAMEAWNEDYVTGWDPTKAG